MVNSTLLSSSTREGHFLSPSERGQLWNGPVPRTCSSPLTDSQVDEIVKALVIYFPNDLLQSIHNALTPPEDMRGCQEPKKTSGSSDEELPVLCENCEESPACLECLNCSSDTEHVPRLEPLFCNDCFAIHIATKKYKHHLAQPFVHPKRKPHAIVAHMYSLLGLIEALTKSETSFLENLNKILKIINQISFCTSPSVNCFITSAACTGFRIGVESLTIVSEMFLEALKELHLDQWYKKLKSIEYSSIDILLSQITSLQSSFTITIQKFLPCFKVYSGIVKHFESLSVLINDSMSDSDFGAYIPSVEENCGESLLRLFRMPLDHVVHYVETCRGLYLTVVSVAKDLDDEYMEVLHYNENLTQRVYCGMINVLFFCYHEANEERHRRNLHELYQCYAKGGTEINIAGLVTPGRHVIRKGKLKRHYKLGRKGKVRLIHVHVLSDVILGASDVYEVIPPPPPEPRKSVSFENSILKKKDIVDNYISPEKEYDHRSISLETEYDLVQDSLRLDFCISLSRQSGTVCLPLPSCFPNTESPWFVIVSARKFIYLCAESVEERNLWVHTIQNILTENKSNNDLFRVKNQLSLVNTLLSEINSRCKERLETAEKNNHEESVDIKKENVSYIQPNWWGLYDLLEVIVRENGECTQAGGDFVEQNTLSPISHLREVISLHSKEFRETILSLCDTDNSRIEISNALSAGSPNSAAEHLIAVGWFFQRSEVIDEKPSPDAQSSPAPTRRWGGGNDTRPHTLLLFVMSNIVLAVRVLPNDQNSRHYCIQYAYHIELKCLECLHYIWGTSEHNMESPSKCEENAVPKCIPSSAILLRDTSISAKFKSLLVQNSASERIIYAPSIEDQQKWLRFLKNCINMFKSYDCGAADSVERVKMLRKFLPNLRRVSTKINDSGIWMTE